VLGLTPHRPLSAGLWPRSPTVVFPNEQAGRRHGARDCFPGLPRIKATGTHGYRTGKQKLNLGNRDTVILDLLSNCAFMGTDSAGLPTEAVRAEDGRLCCRNHATCPSNRESWRMAGITGAGGILFTWPVLPIKTWLRSSAT
jgi:hypothetical protein